MQVITTDPAKYSLLTSAIAELLPSLDTEGRWSESAALLAEVVQNHVTQSVLEALAGINTPSLAPVVLIRDSYQRIPIRSCRT